jgi:hypothetical protein
MEAAFVVVGVVEIEFGIGQCGNGFTVGIVLVFFGGVGGFGVQVDYFAHAVGVDVFDGFPVYHCTECRLVNDTLFGALLNVGGCVASGEL